MLEDPNEYYPLASEETLRDVATSISKNDPDIKYWRYDFSITAGNEAYLIIGSECPMGVGGYLTNIKAKTTLRGIPQDQEIHLYAKLVEDEGDGNLKRLDDARIDFLNATSSSNNPGIFGNAMCTVKADKAKMADHDGTMHRPHLIIKNNGTKPVELFVSISASKRYVVIP